MGNWNRRLGMREIKFRAWDSKEKIMSYVTDIKWEDLDSSDDPSEEEIIGKNGVGKMDVATQKIAWIHPGFGKDALMQYTGFKDCNGKEIYEGDVVKDVEERGGHHFEPPEIEVLIGKVEFQEDGSWWIKDIFNNDDLQLFECAGHCEVVGNIYENKDLLKDEE
jgi:uncharacterized phage protein (TIGR01671 family)